MSVKIRLRRLGRSHAPFYHIVASDSRSPRDGKYIEQIGTYDPIANPQKVRLDHEKAFRWLTTGAQPTETVRSILSHEGLMLKLHLWRKKKSAEEIEAGYQAWKIQKDKKIESEALKQTHAAKADAAARFDGERKRREARAEKIAAKLKAAEAKPEPAAEAPASAAAAEAAPEAPAAE